MHLANQQQAPPHRRSSRIPSPRLWLAFAAPSRLQPSQLPASNLKTPKSILLTTSALLAISLCQGQLLCCHQLGSPLVRHRTSVPHPHLLGPISALRHPHRLVLPPLRRLSRRKSRRNLKPVMILADLTVDRCSSFSHEPTRRNRLPHPWLRALNHPKSKNKSKGTLLHNLSENQ